MCGAKEHVRFAPNSDRESGLPQTVMSALPPKADMCGARGYVRFGPKADMDLKMRDGGLMTFLQLRHDLVQVKAGRLLPLRELPERRQELAHIILRGHHQEGVV